MKNWPPAPSWDGDGYFTSGYIGSSDLASVRKLGLPSLRECKPLSSAVAIGSICDELFYEAFCSGICNIDVLVHKNKTPNEDNRYSVNELLEKDFGVRRHVLFSGEMLSVKEKLTVLGNVEIKDGENYGKHRFARISFKKPNLVTPPTSSVEKARVLAWGMTRYAQYPCKYKFSDAVTLRAMPDFLCSNGVDRIESDLKTTGMIVEIMGSSSLTDGADSLGTGYLAEAMDALLFGPRNISEPRYPGRLLGHRKYVADWILQRAFYRYVLDKNGVEVDIHGLIIVGGEKVAVVYFDTEDIEYLIDLWIVPGIEEIERSVEDGFKYPWE